MRRPDRIRGMREVGGRRLTSALGSDDVESVADRIMQAPGGVGLDG